MARKLTLRDTPQLNGVAKRLDRTQLERIRAFAHGSGLPKSLWGEALRHAVWLKNRTATRALDRDGKMPFGALYGRPPDLSALRVWGCQVWVHNSDGSKLDVRARESHWLGFHVNACGLPRTVTVERNIYFATSALSEGEGTLIPALRGEQTDAPTDPTTSLTPESPPAPPSAAPATPLHTYQGALAPCPQRAVRRGSRHAVAWFLRRGVRESEESMVCCGRNSSVARRL